MSKVNKSYNLKTSNKRQDKSMEIDKIVPYGYLVWRKLKLSL